MAEGEGEGGEGGGGGEVEVGGEVGVDLDCISMGKDIGGGRKWIRTLHALGMISSTSSRQKIACPHAPTLAYRSLSSAQASTSLGLFSTSTVNAVMASGILPRLLSTATRLFLMLKFVGSSLSTFSYSLKILSSSASSFAKASS